ncbi:MAG: TonB-dependent receptor [Bacteroidales bacterium]|nr:TonB-dependent receptor [Bacteroidales bacterium]
MKRFFSICLPILLLASVSFAQQQKQQNKNKHQYQYGSKHKSDAHLVGHVLNGNEHIPFASIVLKGTTIGTSTDETGHYRIINIPEGTYTVAAIALGFSTAEKEVTIKAGQTLELNFKMSEDAIGLDEVVVTGDRNEQRRKESSVVVNTITPKIFSMTQSIVLSEGLNFSPGLRMENNCQNCGFTQLRMNGMEGPYSQILINSRPIFSGLAGVYGLELIPSNMVDRLEIIKGGGSALYGSNAIAGTVNLILKDPINNSYEFGLNSGFNGIGMSSSGGITPDNSINFSATAVSSDVKTGLSVFGFVRNRDPFDADNDTFSELASIENTSIGARAFHRFGKRSKIAADFFNIREDRRGGDRHEYPVHEAGIAEAVKHNITTGALTFDHFFRDLDLLSIFVSAQHIDRDSYYGANKSLSDYGYTNDLTYTAGAQYKLMLDNTKMIFGVENQGGNLKDTKLGYPDYENVGVDGIIPHTNNMLVADQTQNTTGAFTQVDYTYGNFKTTAGIRYDYYMISDKKNPANDITGNVLSPRVTAMYNFNDWMQARLSYARGYRAPQIFDEDLHIETSGSRKVVHENSANLEQETSNSFMASLDINQKIGNTGANLLIEGFYTMLNNPFANEFGAPDENGVVVYTRINAEDGATVKGVNSELTVVPATSLSLRAGFTLQQSMFEAEQEFDERKFFRTPNSYGFFTTSWNPIKCFGVNATGTYTGSMLVPYFGENEELRESDPFFDLGIKLTYNVKINGATLQLFGGMKNIFNSYQNDFDTGINRDPGYLYGPNQPRMVYMGIRIGNRLR